MALTCMKHGIECRFDDTGRESRLEGTLGRVVYGGNSGRPRIEEGVPVLPLHMYADADEGFVESWMSASGGDITASSAGNLVFAHDGEFLFCTGFIPASSHYTDAACELYADAFALIGELGYPQIFRMWNFIPDINAKNGEGLEVYRDFCRGRALAFERHHAVARQMPAATGIGTQGAGVGFYFLACKDHDVTHLENSRQVSAYRYPSMYGPKAPSFARATYLSTKANPKSGTLFVSGTASILGHATMHPGDAASQCEVALANIAHLIGEENLAAHGVNAGFTLRNVDYVKAYYRRSGDRALVMDACRRALSPDAEVRFMHVDICREDLLVEFECVAR